MTKKQQSEIFLSNLKVECAKKDTSISKLMKDLGMSTGTSSAWKKEGRLPNANTLQEIANFLGVAVSDLLIGIDSSKSSSVFYDKLTVLCAASGTAISNFAENELHVDRSTASRWQRGCKPNRATVLMIAKFFNVSKEYLTDDSIPVEYGNGDVSSSAPAAEHQTSTYNMEKQTPSHAAQSVADMESSTTDRIISLWERDKEEAKVREERLFNLLSELQGSEIRLVSDKVDRLSEMVERLLSQKTEQQPKRN